MEDSFTIVKTPDTEPPLLVSASATDAGHVLVEFSETLDSNEATDPSNYSIAGLSVSQASLVNGDRSVELTTSTMTAGAHYTLVVNGVQDLVLNTITADSSIEFDFFERLTVAFQDGLAPNPAYDGTADAYIREASPDANYGLSTSLQVDGDDPGGTGNDMNILLGWDISSIPAGSIVESATVQLEVTDVSSGAYACRRLLKNWVQSEVTWNTAASGSAWGIPGAEAESDRDSQVVCTISAGSIGAMLMNVDLNLVQSWIDDPSGNHGMVISDPSITNGADFHSSESGTAMARPRLEITYRLPVTPPSNTPPLPALLSAVQTLTAASPIRRLTTMVRSQPGRGLLAMAIHPARKIRHTATPSPAITRSAWQLPTMTAIPIRTANLFRSRTRFQAVSTWHRLTCRRPVRSVAPILRRTVMTAMPSPLPSGSVAVKRTGDTATSAIPGDLKWRPAA